MKRLITQYPVLAMSAYTLHSILLFPLLQLLFPTADLMILKVFIMVEMIATGAIMISVMGWWRESGFNGPRDWRKMRLHWIGLVLPLAAIAILGIHVTAPGQLIGLALTTIVIGLQEEMLYRGLMMRALLPGGALRAAVITAVLFGVLHIGHLFGGADPVYTLVQVLASALGGFGLGAIRIRTNTVWGLIGLHAINDFVMFITRDEVNVTQAQSTFYLVGKIAYCLVMLGYGLYLLRGEFGSRKTATVGA